ncbi:hypothetical protein [Azonexus fungiphilus]|uniref:hypothetical protein n=1 Tax=Azonexus fungiphilus TaxID=146940 RepID=UPI0020C3D0DA|nr:hypothetical protein [Azonexus fungiphilus]
MDVILEAGEDKVKAYLLLAGQVARTFKAILPDAEANAYAPMSVLVSYLGAMIKALRPAPDISGVMSDLDALLDDSIATEGYRIGDPSDDGRRFATPSAETESATTGNAPCRVTSHFIKHCLKSLAVEIGKPIAVLLQVAGQDVEGRTGQLFGLAGRKALSHRTSPQQPTPDAGAA